MAPVSRSASLGCLLASGLAFAWPAPAEDGGLPLATDRVAFTPDLMQTEPEAGFAGHGNQYCGPVAASNSLVWLAQHGYPALLPSGLDQWDAQVRMAKELAGPGAMDTRLDDGTSPAQFLRGLKAYVEHCGYAIDDLSYDGPRYVPLLFRGGSSAPVLSRLVAALGNPHAAAWLSIAWCAYDPARRIYTRTGGHWVTVVGCGTAPGGHPDPAILIVHNPSPRRGPNVSHDRITLQGIAPGRQLELAANAKGPRLDGSRYFLLGGDIQPRIGSDAAVLTGVVILALHPPSR